MATQISHSGGLVDVILELGFDEVKYFEGDITGTASGFTIDPPARRVQLLNKDDDNDIYFRINGGDAVASVSFTPGDDIKIGPGCSFTMDYDAISNISFITSGNTAKIEGILGWKGTKSC